MANSAHQTWNQQRKWICLCTEKIVCLAILTSSSMSSGLTGGKSTNTQPKLSPSQKKSCLLFFDVTRLVGATVLWKFSSCLSSGHVCEDSQSRLEFNLNPTALFRCLDITNMFLAATNFSHSPTSVARDIPAAFHQIYMTKFYATVDSVTFQHDRTWTICQTNLTAWKDLMSATHPRPHSSKTKNNNPKLKRCPLCSFLALSPSGWPFPCSLMCQSNNCTSRLFSFSLWLVSPLACSHRSVCTLLGCSNRRPQPVQPLIQPNFTPPAQCNHTANSQADGRKAIRDGRFLCN